MFKWHGKEHSNFWSWVAQHVPKKLLYFGIINETAGYMAKYPKVHIDSISAMDLAIFLES